MRLIFWLVSAAKQTWAGPRLSAAAAGCPAAWTRTCPASGVPFQLRTGDEFAELAFRGLELADPGLVVV